MRTLKITVVLAVLIGLFFAILHSRIANGGNAPITNRYTTYDFYKIREMPL